MSKLAQAIEIVTKAREQGQDKKAILADIQNALGVSKGNASVYYFKARQSLDGAKPEPVAEAPVQEVQEDPGNVAEAELAAYEVEMADRESRGFTSMSFSEWKKMSDSIESLKGQFA